MYIQLPFCIADSLCSSSLTRWLAVSKPWLIFSYWPCVSFLMACRSFSSIFIFLSSSPSRSSTLQRAFPRPGTPLAEGFEAEEPGRRAPWPTAAGPWGGGLALPVAGVGGLVATGVPLLLLVPVDVSVRFRAAGPISAWKRTN